MATSESEKRRSGPRAAEEAEVANAAAQAAADPAPDQATTEATEAPEAAEPMHPEVERLTLELEGARRRVDELARAYQSLHADREDFKRRLTREREQMIDVEKGKVAQALLEAIDELDRCLAASPQDTSPLAEGVRLIRGNLLSRAQAEGVERMELEGRPFDPNLAEAVDMELTADPEADQRVVAVVRAGYRLKDRVIRAARVRVAKYVKPAEA